MHNILSVLTSPNTFPSCVWHERPVRTICPLPLPIKLNRNLVYELQKVKFHKAGAFGRKLCIDTLLSGFVIDS